MQRLYLVGVTAEEGREAALIFRARDGATATRFLVPVTEELLAALERLRGEVGRPRLVHGSRPPPKGGRRGDSTLSVREIQARLRSGQPIEVVAEEAGVDDDWVARFAAPVLAEQAEVIRAVRSATFVKRRHGPSVKPLDESVYRNLRDRGIRTPIDELDRGWTARLLVDGVWLVSLRYPYRGRYPEAEWEYDERTRRVRARGRLASELAYRAPNDGTDEDEQESPDHDDTGRFSLLGEQTAVARRAATSELLSAVQAATQHDAEVASRGHLRPVGPLRLERLELLSDYEVEVPPTPPEVAEPEPELEREPEPEPEPEPDPKPKPRPRPRPKPVARKTSVAKRASKSVAAKKGGEVRRQPPATPPSAKRRLRRRGS